MAKQVEVRMPGAGAKKAEDWVAAGGATTGSTAPVAAPSAASKADKEAKVRITVDLPKSLHKRFRAAAMDADSNMGDVVRHLVIEWLNK